jgi:hypothetical protein
MQGSLLQTDWSMILKSAAYLLMGLLACDLSPALAELFTPPYPIVGRYELCTTAQPIAALAPGEMKIEAVDPLEAFGTAGSYDRFAVVRLYGGTQAQVGRRWTDAGGEFQSQTFISPYPDATLTRLVPGTMIITLRVPRGPRAGARP